MSLQASSSISLSAKGSPANGGLAASKPSKILIGITGGVAAYKLCEVTSTLAKAGIEVRVMMTRQSQSFVSALTFAALSRHPVYTDDDFWSAKQARPLHIELGEWADVFVIAPLSANTLAKLAHGLADNLLTNTVLASTCPVLLAPAMNTDMWQQAAVQRNWQQLETCQLASRYHSVGPDVGRLACDRIGTGRMAEPSEIVTAIYSLSHTKGRRDLLGKHLLISGGTTQEYLDPVRFIGNPATGRMGIALAQAASHRGAEVTLVHGPLAGDLANTIPAPIRTIAVTAAADMESAMRSAQPSADWTIMSAAVADIRPTHSATYKLPKAELPTHLSLSPVPDIVAQLAQQKSPGQRIIGFAAQTGDIVTPALSKLKGKQLDAIVTNPIDKPDSGFGSANNQAVILLANGQQRRIDNGSKLSFAHQLYDCLATYCQ
ncbi:bifunctional phosphopantothenoylcysteine decarboxylase/phosphopantothenate--cysteine ligase CoaBC [cf. Phormidesmis sp. LEGE 11477]|uniref:bifunctional phosphopantothenoylcysteine decarboxylase/phosphopantothenate--cysteine ligase CoaBC n=1 Tax=cf. Phormidesmis sp. LEGE 11477 TaxID=1828680 RepID=UPI00187E9B8B|nr:bifunctional phosphopantothenoylcysteine decarboxylase/phosphopantothenate--cysteine ligase CoaBC [cf. Phormidesmis sp. LEGE 11477]MBE9059994.1 bifunctional phosphopantothenoylcysteine decarboxylase/phosphopantothenate--cysteine ligase CoaBC [cf. Phormidesmis sp. LEGE 11477]